MLLQVRDMDNDTEVLLKALGDCVSSADILAVMSRVQGPWAFVYYQVSCVALELPEETCWHL